MSKRIPSHYIQINKPAAKKLSAAELIQKILERDQQEDRAERVWKQQFEQWWERKRENASRAREIRRLALAGTIERHGPTVCTLTLEEWQAIQARYQYKCAYCHKKRPLTKDHIVPISKGGFHTRINVIPACQSCNSRKRDKPAFLYEPRLIPFM